ncbi:hypothetical protein IQ02_01942 [Flavobacterium glaciei]|uniref:Uncharacterized protein n=1 Tax=Flavobacterium glaciei TaxID=386300 RepID=A0A562PQF6_9FLAO|nr:hypothetical protein DFR66_10981 [Flavobacterium glaciei]TWI46420.1 hypothetical protein IQ02_01942 [Flavobacterium glaciei]
MSFKSKILNKKIFYQSKKGRKNVPKNEIYKIIESILLQNIIEYSLKQVSMR